MISTNDIDALSDAKVVDRDGEKVGSVGQVYVSDEGAQPLFVTVRTGLFGTNESFVPLSGADFTDHELRVAYDKATIKDAPNIDADGAISEDEQGSIFDYYDAHAGGTASGTAGTRAGLTGTDSGDRFGTDSRDRFGTDSRDRFGTDSRDRLGTDSRDRLDGDRLDTDSRDRFGTDTTDRLRSGGTDRSDASGAAGFERTGHDTSGPTTDDAMTRSEERLHVGTERVETGRVRLRKHVVTEQQNVTVPVSHEEVRLEREPITDANRGDALSGPDLSEEEHEVVLTEERPVVEKETVPVERVSLGTEEVTEQRRVSEDVAHEEITTDGADRDRR